MSDLRFGFWVRGLGFATGLFACTQRADIAQHEPFEGGAPENGMGGRAAQGGAKGGDTTNGGSQATTSGGSQATTAGGSGGDTGTPAIGSCTSDDQCNDPQVSVGECSAEGYCVCPPMFVINPRSGGCTANKGKVSNAADDALVSEFSIAMHHDLEGAVLYKERASEEPDSPARLVLQRFDDSASFFAASVEIQSGPASELNSLALAADAEHYLACWAGAGRITCSALKANDSTPMRVFEAEGHSVAVAYASGTWLIAYATGAGFAQPVEFVLRSLSSDFQPRSATRSFMVGEASSGDDRVPLLTAAGSGFAFVADDPARNGHAQFYRLNADLDVIGAPVDLGVPFWVSGSVAASADLAAVSLAQPYAMRLALIDSAGTLQTFDLEGQAKTGFHAALAIHDQSAVAGWVTDDSQIHSQEFMLGQQGPDALTIGVDIDLELTTFRRSFLFPFVFYRADSDGTLSRTSQATGVANRPLFQFP